MPNDEDLRGRTAAGLLALHLELLPKDLDAWLALFADDAVVEFPYAPSLGRARDLEGKAAIGAYFRAAMTQFRDLRLTRATIHRAEDATVAVGEVHGEAIAASTGRPYEQEYVMVVASRDGKIARYREYWNPLPGIAAFGDALTRLGTEEGS